MKIFVEENLNKIDGFIKQYEKPHDRPLEFQQELKKFMYDNKIHPMCTALSKKMIEVLAKMRITRNNPEELPNWCVTLPDGSQIVWNRKVQRFYHIEGLHCEQASYLDYMELFPGLEISAEDKWLIDNWNWFLYEHMKFLYNVYTGTFQDVIFDFMLRRY